VRVYEKNRQRQQSYNTNIVIYLGDLGNGVTRWYVLSKQLFSNLLGKIKNCSLNLILSIGTMSNRLSCVDDFPMGLKFQLRQVQKIKRENNYTYLFICNYMDFSNFISS